MDDNDVLTLVLRRWITSR